MSARDRILARLSAVPVPPRPAPATGAFRPFAGTDRAGQLESLTRNLSAARAEVVEVGRGDWQSRLAAICRDKGVKTLMLPADGAGIAAWEGGPELRRFDRPMEELKEALFKEVDAGFTRAECAIAETGTLAHLSSPAQPRSLSLVPPIHFCLVDGARLHPDLPSALAAENWAAAMPTNLFFVSGPSKTADIQQTLAYGAHGPRELVVLLITGEEAA